MSDTPLRSPLVSAFNNIVKINRSRAQMGRTKNSLDDFLRFMNVETKNLEAIKLPNQKETNKISTTNVSSTFGRPGSLLAALASGAMDVASFVGDFFRGKKGPSAKSKAIPKSKGIRLGGLKAVGIANAAFAGLDFATGLAEGESVGKAAAGAGGALAGSLLGGAIGQALIPVPGLGFVVGSMAGNFLGGFLGDRAHEAITGEGVKEKQEQKLAENEAQQKASAESAKQKNSLSGIINKFDDVVFKFEQAVYTGTLSGSPGSISVSDDSKKDHFHKEIPERRGGGKGPENPVEGSYMVSGGEMPSKYVNTLDFGENRGSYSHHGEDLPINQGTPVSLVVPGTVRQAQFSNNAAGGNILITHEDGKETRYLHMSEIYVSPGQKVESGQVIGATGGAPGTKGAGRSSGPHLHFEYYPSTTAGVADPNPHMDKYFRFGGNIQVTPKATTPSGEPGGTAPTAVLMAGTNDYGNPAAGAEGVRRSIQNLRDKGYNVVVVPPSSIGGPSAVSKEIEKVATEMGATIRRGEYMKQDNSDAIGYAHLTRDSADAIAKEYEGATFVGDSNAQLIPNASIAKPGMSASGIADQIKSLPTQSSGTRQMGRGAAKRRQDAARASAAASAAPKVEPVPQQQSPSQKIEQYPSYNTQQSQVMVIPVSQDPVVVGGGQRPVVINSGGGGGGTIVMPPPNPSVVLNSLFKTALLTTLSST